MHAHAGASRASLRTGRLPRGLRQRRQVARLLGELAEGAVLASEQLEGRPVLGHGAAVEQQDLVVEEHGVG